MTNASVTSADGTTICYKRRGNGDPVIVVNTVAEDRSGLSGLADLLAEHFTVYTYDRRGRGDSGDTKPYAPEREVEDLAVVIEAAGDRASLVSGSAGCPGPASSATHTYAYDGRICAGTQDGRPLPRDRWRTEAPVLVAIGENSEPYFSDGARDLAEVLPQVTVETLPGQDHAALWMAPEVIVASARRFFLSN